MKAVFNSNKLIRGKGILATYPYRIKQMVVVLFFLWSPQIFAQQEAKVRNFSVQVGINSGILSGSGPSFSFHYARPTEKVFQFESMLFVDRQSGSTFLSGDSQKRLGIGFAAGTRIQIHSEKSWTPSLMVMPGLMYSSDVTSRYDDPGRRGVSGAFCLAFSTLYKKKHMVSLGLNAGQNIFAPHLKYGYWF